MKRIILLLLCLSMLISSLSVSAAVDDDAYDGVLEWCGYRWAVDCGNIGDLGLCSHGYIYIDDEDTMNFHLAPCANTAENFHRVEIPRGTEGFEEQIEWCEYFDVEYEMQVSSYGEGIGVQLFDPDMRIYLVLLEEGIQYHGADGYYIKNIALDNRWNKWRIEKRGMHLNLYLNDEVVLSYELPTLTYTDMTNGAIRFYATPSKNVAQSFKVRQLSTRQYSDMIEMTPAFDSVYEYGEKIDFCAKPTDSPEWVKYYVGDVCIGTATAETGYVYSAENMNIGSYNVRAVTSTGQYAVSRTVSVKKTQNVELSAPERIAYGESAEFSVTSASDIAIEYVDFYVNGQLTETVGEAPYLCNVDGLKVGTSSSYANVFFADGTCITSDTAYTEVETTNEGNFEILCEYDLSYDYFSGDGSVYVTDGYFKLELTHNEAGVTYAARDGYETYSSKAGTYYAIVSSGIADVYRDGQLAFSFYMPRCNDASSFEYSGVENVTLGGSGVKTELFFRNLNSEKQFTEENLNMGLYYSLEFDKTDSSSESILLFDGEYEISLKFNGKISALCQPMTEGEVSEKTVFDEVTPGYYRLTVYRGIAQLFRDNKFLCSFRAPKTAHKKTLRRVMAHSGTSTFVAIKNTDDVFYFDDDFEQDNVRDGLEYWYRIYGNTTAAISDGKISFVGSGTYVFDAVSENPELSFKMTLPEVEITDTESGSNGCEGDSDTSSAETVYEAAISVRYRDEYDNVRLTYSYSSKGNGVWMLTETEKGTTRVIAEASKTISTGEEHNCEILVDNNRFTFLIDGEKIFDGVNLTFLGNGKIAFSPISFGTITLDDFSYKGNGKANSGINYKYFNSSEINGTVEFYRNRDDGSVNAYLLEKQYTTNNKGETWTGPANARSAYQVLDLKSGNRLLISDWGGQTHADLRDADGNTIVSNSVVQSSTDDVVSDRHGMGGRLIQTRKVWGTKVDAAPRVLYVTSQGSEVRGTTTVYYSDDEGRTWSQSQTNMDYESLGEFYGGEADIVDLPDGRVRVYFRCNRGFLYYVDSYDGGKTFDIDNLTASQFMTPSTAFAIQRDPDEDNVYYMMWQYDVATSSLTYIQYPRNRMAIAVSHDGCESWEYIMEFENRGSKAGLWYVNACMRIYDGLVYVNHGYSGNYRFSDLDLVSQAVYVIDPERINTVKRFSDANYIEPDFSTIYDEYPNQAVIPKITGTAMIYGNKIPVRIDEKGMIEARVFARVLGADITESDDGVSLSIGGGRVDVSKGQKAYQINGEEFATDEICLSEDGKYLNGRVFAKIFGKTYTETESSMFILSKNISEVYKAEIENLVSGVSGSLEACIDEFKSISNADELKAFFVKYKQLLNLSTDFSDKSYENMFGKYCETDVAAISDYEGLTTVLDSLITDETGRVKEFLEALNAASAEGDGAVIEQLLTDTYADLISIDTGDVVDWDAVYKRMTGITYYSIGDVENIFRSSLEAQLFAENGRSNEVSLSTVSNGFKGWTEISHGVSGGASEVCENSENVLVVSAYEGVTDKGVKTEVEAAFEKGLVYYAPGAFDEKVTADGVALDAKNGTVVFSGGGSLSITGDGAAMSNTIVTVFDVTKPEGTFSGTFSSGYSKGTIEFDAGGTSLGELPDELKAAEALTYRVECSMGKMSVYVKAKDAEDMEYCLLGIASIGNISKTNWSVSFASSDLSAEIWNIGVYSALASVRFDTSELILRDNIYYSTKGEDGHTWEDLIAHDKSGLSGTYDVDEEGNLRLIRDENSTVQAVLNLGTGSLLTGGFDRAELEFTIKMDDKMFFYFNDNSGMRCGANFQPTNINGTPTNYPYGFSDGCFFDIKWISTVAGYDSEGNRKTSVCVYAKKHDEEEWVCLAQEMILNRGMQKTPNVQICFLNGNTKQTITLSDLNLKTYCNPSGTYSATNQVVDMPEADYVYSFDYMRMDDNIPTIFTIGGEDYGQTFVLDYYRISTDKTYSMIIDMDIEEDKWYRFFGKVKMTEEKEFSLNSSKTIKNTISMYAEDEDGNITVLFEDLPMLRCIDSNGIRFGTAETIDAGFMLKNIRIYNGKALDIVDVNVDGSTAEVTVDFLNDDDIFEGQSEVFVGAYEGETFLGAGMDSFSNNVAAYEAKRLQLNEIDLSMSVEPTFKVFMWQNFVPVTAAALCE